MVSVAKRGVFVATIFFSLGVIGGGRAVEFPTLAVVVNPRNPMSHIAIRELAAFYGARSRFWRDGSSVIPINREASSPVREAFSTRVFRRSSREMTAYWNERYFHGVFPPLVLASDEAVLRYVARNPQAIGYVAASSVDDRGKVIRILRPR